MKHKSNRYLEPKNGVIRSYLWSIKIVLLIDTTDLFSFSCWRPDVTKITRIILQTVTASFSKPCNLVGRDLDSVRKLLLRSVTEANQIKLRSDKTFNYLLSCWTIEYHEPLHWGSSVTPFFGAMLQYIIFCTCAITLSSGINRTVLNKISNVLTVFQKNTILHKDKT